MSINIKDNLYAEVVEGGVKLSFMSDHSADAHVIAEAILDLVATNKLEQFMIYGEEAPGVRAEEPAEAPEEPKKNKPKGRVATASKNSKAKK